jgi:membrane protease YdiL (CAAX protease family)
MNEPQQGRTVSWLRPLPPQRPFHQLARNDVYRWWRPVVALLFVVVFGVAAMLALTLGMLIVVRALTGHWLEFAGSGEEIFTNDLANLFALLASVAILLPVVLIATLVIDRRSIGSLSSVRGHLRWRWLALCLVPAIGYMLASIGMSFVLEFAMPSRDQDLGGWIGWADFWPALLVIVLIVPIQAAAEEYAFRGWLLQAIGSWTARIGSSAWPAILISAIPFVVGHGYTDWGPVDIGLFAVATGWVVVQTGGLEAAIALHIVNNMTGMVLAAHEGDLSLTEGSIPWTDTLTSAVPLLVWALVVVWMFGHTGSKRPMKRLS